jgi:hypothetical protein
MPKRSTMKVPEGKVPRGRLIRLYPTLEEKQHLRLVQDEARFAWNLLVAEYNRAVEAQFRKAELDGVIGPKPSKPDKDDEREVWTEWFQTIAKRRKLAREHGKELQMSLPKSDKSTYSRLMKAWEEHQQLAISNRQSAGKLIADGRKPIRRMTANMYQALIVDFAAAMIPKKGAIRWRPPRYRKDGDDMPIRTGSGLCVKPSGDKKRNALVGVPGLGWVLGICHRDLSAMVPGTLVQGVALRERTDGWYAAVRVYVPKPEPIVPLKDCVEVRMNNLVLAELSDGRSWINPRSQVVDMDLPKDRPAKVKRMPVTGWRGDGKVDNKWRESPERAHTRRARHVGCLIDSICKHLSQYRKISIPSEVPKAILPKGARQDAYSMAMGRLHTAIVNRFGERVEMTDFPFDVQ